VKGACKKRKERARGSRRKLLTLYAVSRLLMITRALSVQVRVLSATILQAAVFLSSRGREHAQVVLLQKFPLHGQYSQVQISAHKFSTEKNGSFCSSGQLE